MTTYNYMSEMQQLCFRATKALKELGDDGLYDFYAAAEKGFDATANSLPYEEANKDINQSQTDAFINLKDFVEDKEYKAAEKIKEVANENIRY